MAIALKFTGSDEGARATAEALARSLDQLGISADNVKFQLGDTKKGTDTLYSSLKDLKGEAVQHQRVFGFFGRQLAETGLVARETATALVGLGTGLASGMYVMAAVEAVKLLADAFKDVDQESQKALDKIDAATRKVVESQRDLADKAAGVSKTMREQIAALAELQTQEAKLAALKAAEATAWGTIKVIAKELIGVGDKQVENAEKELAARRQLGFELAALANREAGAAKSDAEAKAREDAYRREAADWKAFQDQITASGIAAATKEAQAEAKIREDARKKEEQDIVAWQKEMERIEGPEAQRKAERAMQEHDRKRDLDALNAETAATNQLAAAGAQVADIFGNIGQAMGGSFGGMTAIFGKLIQQAIQLTIAIAGTGGPFAWLNVAAAAATMIATIKSVPQFRAAGGPVMAGSPYIVGELGRELFVPDSNGAIVPNAALGGGDTYHVTINAMDGASVERVLRRNQGALLKTLSDAARNRRKA